MEEVSSVRILNKDEWVSILRMHTSLNKEVVADVAYSLAMHRVDFRRLSEFSVQDWRRLGAPTSQTPLLMSVAPALVDAATSERSIGASSDSTARTLSSGDGRSRHRSRDGGSHASSGSSSKRSGSSGRRRRKERAEPAATFQATGNSSSSSSSSRRLVHQPTRSHASSLRSSAPRGERAPQSGRSVLSSADLSRSRSDSSSASGSSLHHSQSPPHGVPALVLAIGSHSDDDRSASSSTSQSRSSSRPSTSRRISPGSSAPSTGHRLSQSPSSLSQARSGNGPSAILSSSPRKGSLSRPSSDPSLVPVPGTRSDRRLHSSATPALFPVPSAGGSDSRSRSDSSSSRDGTSSDDDEDEDELDQDFDVALAEHHRTLLADRDKFRSSFGPARIRRDEVSLSEPVGEGGYATVYRGDCRGKEVAVKVLDSGAGESTSNFSAEFMDEVAIMSTLYHPNIALFMGVVVEPGANWMISEFLNGGSVFDLLQRDGHSFSTMECISILLQTCQGMNWLHSRSPTPVLHLDLKPQNLLLDRYGVVKVCDFGVSRLLAGSDASVVDKGRLRGSLPYMAPERLRVAAYSTPSDVYSFAVTAWEILTRKAAYSDLAAMFELMTPFEFFNHFGKVVAEERRRPSMRRLRHRTLRRIVTRCWVHEAEDRPTFGRLIAWLKRAAVRESVPGVWGQLFWRRHWMTGGSFETEVPFDEWWRALVTELYGPSAVGFVSDKLEACVRAMLCEQLVGSAPPMRAGCVTLEHFGHFCAWFAQGVAHRDAAHHRLAADSERDTLTGSSVSLTASLLLPPIEDAAHILDVCQRLCTLEVGGYGSSPGDGAAYLPFHGNISATTAEMLLATRPPGAWLLRCSTKMVQFPFVVSKVMRGGAISHQRMRFDSDTCRFSVDVMYADTGVVTRTSDEGETALDFAVRVRDELGLRGPPCPGSAFANLTSKDKDAGGYVLQNVYSESESDTAS